MTSVLLAETLHRLFSVLGRQMRVAERRLIGLVSEHMLHGLESDAAHHEPRRAGVVDVLITDLKMPLMTGEELLWRTRSLHPESFVICLSASFTEAWLDLSVLSLSKPFTLRAIDALVRSALEGTRRREAQTGGDQGVGSLVS